MTGQPLPLEQAAQALGLSPGQLRRLVARGAPCVQRGQRGRGRVMTVDPEAVRVWSGASARDAALIELAGVLPQLLGEAMLQAFQLTDGPAKRAIAGPMAAAWFLCASATLDRIRTTCPGVPEIASLPAAIEQLQKISKDR